MQSQLLREILDEAAAKAAAVATRQKAVATLIRILTRKGVVPADLDTAVHAVTDLDALDRLTDLAVDSASLEDFRRDAGL